MPTIVFPAPHGSTITPEPPRALPAAWKMSAASRWYARRPNAAPLRVGERFVDELLAILEQLEDRPPGEPAEHSHHEHEDDEGPEGVAHVPRKRAQSAGRFSGERRRR